jgi:fimbrial chaperone protein
MPFEQQTVRVSWIHNPNPAQELAYRLIAEELPIALEDPTNNKKNKKGGMQMLMRYLTALYIVPNNVEPNVKLQSALKESDEEGNALLAITLNNEGKARTVLKNFSLNIKDSTGNEINLTPEEIPEINRKVLLAKMQRRYVLPWPKNLNEDITVNFDFEIAQ